MKYKSIFEERRFTTTTWEIRDKKQPKKIMSKRITRKLSLKYPDLMLLFLLIIGICSIYIVTTSTTSSSYNGSQLLEEGGEQENNFAMIMSSKKTVNLLEAHHKKRLQVKKSHASTIFEYSRT